MNYNLRQASKLTQTKVSQYRHFRQSKKMLCKERQVVVSFLCKLVTLMLAVIKSDVQLQYNKPQAAMSILKFRVSRSPDLCKQFLASM